MLALTLLVVLPRVVDSAALPETTKRAVVRIEVHDTAHGKHHSGSGTFIDAEAHILTNWHVVQVAAENSLPIWVSLTLSDKSEPVRCVIAEVIASDPELDLALLKASKVFKDGRWYDFQAVFPPQGALPHVHFDRDAVEYGVSQGDELQVLGYPGVGGPTLTYTRGVVAGFQPKPYQGKPFPWWLKTDAKINHGNSGGAAFDSEGSFVGVPEWAHPDEMGSLGYIISIPVVDIFLNKYLGSLPPAQLEPQDNAGATPAGRRQAGASSTAPAEDHEAGQSPVEAYLARGDALLAQNPRDALYAYQDAVRADPNSAKAHFKVGIAYAQLGYFSQAIDAWNRVLKIDPGNQGARDNIQKAQARGGVDSQTAEVQAARASREFVKQNYDQAMAFIHLRRYAEAATALTSALLVEPESSELLVARGAAMVGLDRFQAAVQDYLHGLSINSNQAAPFFGLGEAYRGMGDREARSQA
jgi:S1-C subfamily serine protease